MESIINLIVLIVSSILFSWLYILSVAPAKREQTRGPKAYKECRNLRIAASFAMVITLGTYAAYLFYPLPLPLPLRFSWPHWVSIVIGAGILIPSITLMTIGVIHAGEEALSPKKEHTMYGGIYRKIRHPQAVGECICWLGIAFCMNSPFLALYSLIWLPVFHLFCLAEEKDLHLRYGEPYAEYCQTVGRYLPKRKN